MADTKTKSDAGGDKKDEKKGKEETKEQELVLQYFSYIWLAIKTFLASCDSFGLASTYFFKKCIVILVLLKKPCA